MKNERGFWLGCGLLMCLFLAGSGRWLETTGASALQDARTTRQATSSSSNPPAVSAKGGDEEPETVGDIPGLVSAIIGRISATECSNKKCTIAIPNYELPDGSITVYGLRVADAITRELIKQGYKAGGLELGELRRHITDESPSAEPRNREKTCQMGRKLKLRFVVLGTVEKENDSLAKISTVVIGVDKQNCTTSRKIFGCGPLPLASDLEPIYVPDPARKIAHFAGPHCDYMVNPPYTDLARQNDVSGTIQLAAVINTQGQMEYIRILQGLPFGLNESTIKTMRKWRCQPATKDNVPIRTLVEFETNFRTH